MTVKELKEKLSEYPDDIEVVITVDWTESLSVVRLQSADSHIDHDYVELSC